MKPLLFCIYKPPHMGSFDVVRQFKRLAGKKLKKVGHMGTLDPFAQGLLLISANGASRLTDFVHRWYRKTYWAQGVLGVQTDTLDCDGEVIDVSDVPKLSLETCRERASKMVGTYFQSPPQYSAAKFKGRRLHEYAREGIKVVRPPVKRHVYSLHVESLEGNIVDFRCEVSSGTYVRTLFEDMAAVWGTVGHLKRLVREQIGPFSCYQAQSLEEFTLQVDAGKSLEDLSIPIESKISLSQVGLDQINETRFRNGQKVLWGDGVEKREHKTPLDDSYWWVFGQQSQLIGLGQSQKSGGIAPTINF